MTRSAPKSLLVLACAILTIRAWAQDPVPARELDRRADQALNDAITIGVTLYNSGNHEACYELYRGTAMATARFLEPHAGMRITAAEFDALAGHLVATLEKYRVPRKEMDELVTIVASTKNDIVGQ
jgi:hypothetical protein